MTAPAQTLDALRKKRAGDYRREVAPYFGYMGQSGFPLVISLIVITAGLAYFKLIRDVPADFPFTLAGIIAIVPALCWSPLRTWLASADIVFHLRLEAHMEHYLRRSFVRSYVMTGIITAILLLLYWPIYRHGPGLAPVAMLVVFAIVLKWANTWGAWRERQLAWPNRRRLLRTVRWAATAAGWLAALTLAPWLALLIVIAIGFVLYWPYRLSARLTFPWERLIEEEGRTRRRIYSFLGWFVDVPTLPSRTASRGWLSWMLALVPYRRRNTFVYLYAASLIRTEMGGMLIRLTALFALIAYWFAETNWLNGWGAFAFYLLFIFIIGIQLGGLRRIHAYTVWRHVYPLPDSTLADSIVLVDRWALLISAAIVWLPAGITLIVLGSYLPAVSALLLVVVYITTIRPRKIKRKALGEDDEE
ncbi:ABC transporter permease [Paenibacillus sp. NPDC058071]|uniref:ABC transporter permease n=1 Tax=Paenibacillus sp. NPDC058071 TaxID=3346326 RepID=UPI0036D8E06F